MTALAVITAAYRKIGITNVTSTKAAYGLEDLQNMLSLWSASGLFIPSVTTDILTLAVGQSVYTIGEDGTPDFDTARPVRLGSAFIRIDNTDHNVDVNLTQRDYDSITQKSVNARPRSVYYDTQYPNSNLKFDSPADIAYSLYLTSEKVLTNPTATTSTFSIPLEYNEPMIYNLALRLMPDKNSKVHPSVALMAERGMEVIENYNALQTLSGAVRIDDALVYSTTRRGAMDHTSGGYRR